MFCRQRGREKGGLVYISWYCAVFSCVVIIQVSGFCLNEEVNPYDESYCEKLVISSSVVDKAIITFNFVVNRTTSLQSPHFNLFPKSIGLLASKYNLKEFHLTFTQGEWKREWGIPAYPAPHGVELWASFNSHSESFEGAVRALGGLFCASLQHINSLNTIEPELIHQTRLTSERVGSGGGDRDTLIYGTLHSEAVCTENLTPWANLLPCRKESGIASLLKKPSLLYDLHWHSMGTHFISYNQGEEGQNYILKQTLTLLVDIPPPPAEGKKEFTLKSLFNGQRIKACPLAAKSQVLVPQDHNIKAVSSTLKNTTFTTNDMTFYQFDLNQESAFDLKVTLPDDKQASKLAKNEGPVIVNRYQNGFGKQKGGISIFVKNNLNSTVPTVLMQVIPWYLQLYFHTMSITMNGLPISNPMKFFTEKKLIPAEDRLSPSIMELKFMLLANSTFTLDVEFDKQILHFFEYPPDPNRGFDIGPAVIEVELPCDVIPKYLSLLEENHECTTSGARTYKYNYYTTGLSISLPTPDFSMPYNVITVTSTLLAYFFGQMVRTLIRRYSDLYVDSKWISNRPAAKILSWVVRMLNEDEQTETEKQEEKTEEDKNKKTK